MVFMHYKLTEVGLMFDKQADASVVDQSIFFQQTGRIWMGCVAATLFPSSAVGISRICATGTRGTCILSAAAGGLGHQREAHDGFFMFSLHQRAVLASSGPPISPDHDHGTGIGIVIESLHHIDVLRC